MKAMILAGGRGKRLGDIPNNKCMLVVRGKPLIEYSLECASRTGVDEIIIVVGYKAEEIINAYGNRHNGKPIKYVIQRELKGLVNAIECAKDTIGKSDFMLMLGDELMFGPRHAEMVGTFKKNVLFALCGVVVVDDINLVSKTYSIIESPEKRIYRLIEKPKTPLSNVMGTGNCIFSNDILGYIDQTPINQKRGEKELPDLIQCAIDDGKIVKSFPICDKYFNVNSGEEFQRASSCFAHL
jgi:dTDP-glucose pyrophosphorylase